MIENPYNGAFVVFEGIDGGGKSSQYARIQKFLSAFFPQLRIKYTKEPNKNKEIGAQIYRILNNEDREYDVNSIAQFHMQAFYAEDRVENYRTDVIPALASGIHDLQDRCYWSSISYGSDGPFDFSDFLGLNERMFSVANVPFIRPNLVMLFDAPAEVAMERMKRAGKKLDEFETLKVLQKARNNYLSFAAWQSGCVIIDGTRSEEEIAKEVQALVLPLLGLSK